ncbi:MAG: hypothetical protein UC390_09340, partial [Peptococcaceae bacterium]|nr:hypothetical protein [Peptococcaceae bacterium]
MAGTIDKQYFHCFFLLCHPPLIVPRSAALEKRECRRRNFLKTVAPGGGLWYNETNLTTHSKGGGSAMTMHPFCGLDSGRGRAIILQTDRQTD